jgi:DNA-binding transcriptional LysR family regulator
MSDIGSIDIRRLDGGLLLVFRGLLRRRQTTAVARDLGLSQSAVSHALTRLRDLFGDPLFVRRAHGLEPTRRAQELAPRIDALIDLAGQTLEREGAFDPARTQRLFNLAAPEFVTALIGANLVKAFRKSAPNASFFVTHAFQNAALDALRHGAVDIALGRFGTLSSEFEAETLYEDRYCVVARRSHPTLKGRINYKQYAEIGHVYAGSRSEGSEEELGSAPKDVKFVAIVPGWLTALVLVAESDAIATCPRRLAERQAKLLGLQIIAPPFEPNVIRVSSVRRAANTDPATDWCLDQIRKAAR